MRVPDGSLMFIMNWPGSVRGKKERVEQRKQEQADDDDAGRAQTESRRALQHDADDSIVEIEECFESWIEPAVETSRSVLARNGCVGGSVAWCSA